MAKDTEIKFKVTVNGKEAVATLENIEDVIAKLKSDTDKPGDAPFFDGIGAKALALNQTLNALKESKALLDQTFGDAIRVYDATIQSTLKLEAASKLAGIELATLQGISDNSKQSFGLSERASNEFTISLSKLSSKAGDVSQTGDAIKNLLNVAAAQGLNPEQALVAINQAILGIDEGTDKLFQKNPSVIYQEYAESIGTTAGKLTDMQKAQAMMNELQEVSVKVGDTYLNYQDSAAGKQAQFTASLEETQAAIGGVVRQIAGPFLEAGKSWLQVFNALPDSIQGTLGTLALLLISLKTLQATGIIPNLGALAMLKVQLATVSAAYVSGAGASGVFTAAMTAATTSVRAFFASIPIVGWIALLLSALPLLYDFAKGFLGIGDEIEASSKKLDEFNKKLKASSRFEVETNLSDTTIKIGALEGVISELQQKLLHQKNLGRQGRKELSEQIGIAQDAVKGLKMEAELLQSRLTQLDTAKPGQEGFRGLTQRIDEAESELKKIAELSVDGLIPESEKKRAEELRNELVKLREQKEKLYKDLGLTTSAKVEIPVKLKVDPIEPKDLILDEVLDFDVKINPIVDIEYDFNNGLITSISTVNEALQTLQTEFDNATTDGARQEIQKLKNDLELLKSGMVSSGTSVDDFKAKLKDGALKTVADFDTAIAELNNQLKKVGLDPARKAEIEAFLKSLEELRDKTKEVAAKIELDFGPVIASSLSEVGNALGELMAGGVDSTKNFGLAMQSALANAMKTIGGMILRIGLATAKIMVSPNPFLWIPAGLALIAAGALLGAQVNKAMKKEQKGDSGQAPARQRFDQYATGGIVEENKIIEVGEKGAEMILNAPATQKLRPYFKELNQGLLPAIPIAGQGLAGSNTTVDVNVGGGFKVSGGDLLSVIEKRIRIEKAIGRATLAG